MSQLPDFSGGRFELGFVRRRYTELDAGCRRCLGEGADLICAPSWRLWISKTWVGRKSKLGGDYQIRHAPRRQVVNSELRRRWSVVSSQVE